jgi:hypothetical protein
MSKFTTIKCNCHQTIWYINPYPTKPSIVIWHIKTCQYRNSCGCPDKYVVDKINVFIKYEGHMWACNT